ncbi:hypothetical protein AcV7_000634 [Taiwanofungus camphoratus]|nr:hypothetical protein AcV7_000634 [Antrodia cinnamomea]
MSGFDTIWPADSVEFCPHPDARDVFACGTYRLEDPEATDSTLDSHEVSALTAAKPKRQHRTGKCLLFEVDGEQDPRFSLLQETSLPAVPDIKWCHRTSVATPILGVADSEGHVTLHELASHDRQRELRQIQSITCGPIDVLCLSLDWSNRRSPTSTLGLLVVSLSDGRISLLRAQDQSGLTVTDVWAAHDFEPWIVAWDYWDTNIVYSGGDDLNLKSWDIRQGFSQPLFVNKRFDAGVTTIQSHPYVEHLIAVGSYDNTVRLFDTRKMLSPLVQADVGGGVWRVKWHPSIQRKNDLLVACMHDGFKVVQFDIENRAGTSQHSGAPEWEIRKRFDAHKSLAYGVDWSYDEKRDEADTLIASCSFYDHTLHLWKG